MTTKRLSKPRPKGMVIIPTGQNTAYDLYFTIDQLETALELAGAKPGQDYQFVDLLNGAIKLHGQDALAHEIAGITNALRDLGTGNAATDMGAIELLSLSIKEGFAGLSSAVENLDL